MESAVSIINKIVKNSEKHDNTVPIVLKALKVGEWFRQGDIMVTRVKALKEKGTPTLNPQLAVGNTQGSRHVISGTVNVTPASGKDELEGPTISSESEILLTHPEHNHFKFPAGTYRVTYERDMAMEEKRRVQD